MNKAGLVFCVAAVAALSGCLDPNYKGGKNRPVRQATEPADIAEPYAGPAQYTPSDLPATPVIAVDDQPAAPSSVKTLDATPVAPAPVEPAPAPVATAPVTTEYTIQPGDTLSKISKRYNIKIAAIKAANPQIKGDVVKLGQKIKLPGDVEVAAPAPAPAAAAAPLKPYTGATEEYTIKPGDTLGAIALSRGTSVRQIKQMNNMTTDIVRVGRKLTVPVAKAKAPKAAESKPAAPAKDKEAKPAKPAASAAPAEAAAPAAPVETPAPTSAEAAPLPEAAAPAAPAAQTAKPDYFLYTVKDGEDVTGIAIQWDVSPSEIRQMNNLAEDAQLTGGMEIKLPLPPQQ